MHARLEEEVEVDDAELLVQLVCPGVDGDDGDAANLFCPAVSLAIKGEIFPADLVVLGTQGIDVILGKIGRASCRERVYVLV